MEGESAMIKNLKQRIAELERENNELKEENTSDNFSLINMSDMDDNTSQKVTEHHDIPKSDIEVNEQLYAKYLLRCIDDQIKEHEDSIKATKKNDSALEPNLGYNTIQAYSELRKGLQFRLKRESDKLHIIDEQLKDINKYLSAAPSGNTVLTHLEVNENAYDRLIDKRETVHGNIVCIQNKISTINDALMGDYIGDGLSEHECKRHFMNPANYYTLRDGENKINNHEKQISNLLKEKHNIVQELQSGKLVNRLISDVEQFHNEVMQKEEKLKKAYYAQIHDLDSGCTGKSRYERNQSIVQKQEELRNVSDKILPYLQFVPNQWFKDKFTVRQKFYEDINSKSDYELYKHLLKCETFGLSWVPEPMFKSFCNGEGMMLQYNINIRESAYSYHTLRIYKSFVCVIHDIYTMLIKTCS